MPLGKTQAAQDRDVFESRLSGMEKDWRETKEKLETTTQDLATSKQELSCAHEQLHKTKIQFQEENLKKTEENEDLKRQLQTQVVLSSFKMTREVGSATSHFQYVSMGRLSSEIW